MKQEMMGWQWPQLDHMQIICTLLQRDNHARISSHVFTDWMLFLMPNQQCQSTEGQNTDITIKKKISSKKTINQVNLTST